MYHNEKYLLSTREDVPSGPAGAFGALKTPVVSSTGMYKFGLVGTFGTLF